MTAFLGWMMWGLRKTRRGAGFGKQFVQSEDAALEIFAKY